MNNSFFLLELTIESFDKDSNKKERMSLTLQIQNKEQQQQKRKKKITIIKKLKKWINYLKKKKVTGAPKRNLTKKNQTKKMNR